MTLTPLVPGELLSALMATDKAGCGDAGHAHAKAGKASSPHLYVVTDALAHNRDGEPIVPGVYYAPWTVVSKVVGPIT